MTVDAAVTWLVCIDCHADYRFDESPSDEHCAACSDWHAWWTGQHYEVTG